MMGDNASKGSNYSNVRRAFNEFERSDTSSNSRNAYNTTNLEVEETDMPDELNPDLIEFLGRTDVEPPREGHKDHIIKMLENMEYYVLAATELYVGPYTERERIGRKYYFMVKSLDTIRKRYGEVNKVPVFIYARFKKIKGEWISNFKYVTPQNRDDVGGWNF